MSPRYDRVVLTGFMGAGKSTVGRALAPVLGWRFTDVDSLLTARAGLTVEAWFRLHGEAHFRQQEAALIAEVLHERRTVVALGGGAVEHARTRQLVFNDPRTLAVYLQAPLAVSLARCAGEPGAAVRPVLEDRAALEERFRLRLPFYQRAHLTVPSEAQSPPAIAQAIAAVLAESSGEQA